MEFPFNKIPPKIESNKCNMMCFLLFEHCWHVAVSLNTDKTKRRKGDIDMCEFADWDKASLFGFLTIYNLLFNYCYYSTSATAFLL